MGEHDRSDGGDERDQRDERDEEKLVRRLERGRIAFAVRPRVQGRGVQRFMFLMSPAERELHRLVFVGRRRMPAPGANEREWAYVEKVAGSRAALLADLGARSYMTKTRGLRHQPGVRMIAEGQYGIVGHGEHTHLTYVLDDPSERGPLHDALRIESEASVIAAVFNPLARRPRRARQTSLRFPGEPDDTSPFREPSIYPDELQDRFGDRRFAPLDPAFLDYEGSELVLIGAEDELRPELAVAV